MGSFWVMLLCLAIPLQGFASAYAFAYQQPCPMQQGMTQLSLDADAVPHDCCNDAETANQTGEPCKSPQDCYVAQACGFPMALKAALPSATPCLFAPIVDVRASILTSSVWRPPTRS